MFKTDAITKDWKEAGSFAAQINLFGFWDEHCFLTKTGDLGMAIKIGGIDYESLDRAGRDYAVKGSKLRSAASMKRQDSIRSFSSAIVQQSLTGGMRTRWSVPQSSSGRRFFSRRQTACFQSTSSGSS